MIWCLAVSKRSTNEKGKNKLPGEKIIRTTTFARKNPVNAGSKDALKPPSQSINYTLFSGFPIKELSNKGKDETWLSTSSIKNVLSQINPKVLICGNNGSTNDWNKLFLLENKMIRSSTIFGLALAKLREWEPKAPYLHTDLNLLRWLVNLSRVGSIEAADAYWGVSRGLELLPKDLTRASTSTPNYFKKEHTPYVKSELERVFKQKHIASYEDLKTIFPSLPDQPEDRLGLGFVLKERDDGTLKFRLIVDASRPEGTSVNAHMKEYGTVLPTVLQFAEQTTKDSFFAMADVADAYMNLGLKPYNWKNVIINFDLDGSNVDLAYTRLAFGLRSAVRLFQGIAKLMLQILRLNCKEQSFDHQIIFDMSYIDDSACIATTKKAAAKWLKVWKDLMNELGMPWQMSKIVEPTKRIKLLGLIVDSSTMTLTVEKERVEKALILIRKYEAQSDLTLKQTQSLMGHLNFIAIVVRFARLFTRGLANQVIAFNEWARANGKASSGRHRLPLNNNAKIDLLIWKPLLVAFNGKDITTPTLYPQAEFVITQVDSSFWGAGVWAHGFHKSFSWKQLGYTLFASKEKERMGEALVSTSYVEALGLKHLLITLGPYMTNKFVKIQIDNLGLVHMLRGEKTKSQQVLPVLLECISLIVAYNVKPSFVHISSEEMWFADPLSRLTQPHKETMYKALFKKRLQRFHKRNKAWIPSNPQEIQNREAMDIPRLWKSLLDK